MITTALLLIAVVALVWYGSTYLLLPPSGDFARGPFLTCVTTTEADFAWTLKSGEGPVSLSVRAPDGTVTSAPGGRATGLRPATRYVWTANLDGASAAAGAFSTAPLSTATPITLVSFGDYGSGTAHEYAVARLAAAEHPALFLSAGDNAYLVAAPPFLDRAIFRPLHELLAEAPAVVALGEHDLASPRWGRRDLGAAPPRPPLQRPVRPGAGGRAGLRPMRPRLTMHARRWPGAAALPGAIRAEPPSDLGEQPDHAAAATAARGGDPGRPPAPLRAAPPRRGAPVHDRDGRRGCRQPAYTLATPDALVSFIAYGYLRIGIAGDRISYQFIDQSGRVRDSVERTIQG